MHYTGKRTFRQKLTDYFSSLSSGKTVSILSLLLITILLPVTAFLTRQRQDTKQSAQAATASSPPVYYGVYVHNDFWDFTPIPSFEGLAGKPVAIVQTYQNWATADADHTFSPSWMDQVRAHGSIPQITWQPWDYTVGVNNPQPAFRLNQIYNGAYDSYITTWAQAAKAWGHPFFLRFAHEMNGNWYPWSDSTNGNQPGDYIKAWQHVHDIFTAQGATNVTWVWCPNVEGGSASTPLSQLYPGDTYVDWVCMDGYNWGTQVAGFSWQTFSQVFTQTYTDFGQLAPSKPIMIGEFSSAETGGSKAAWITDALSTQLPNNFPNIKAVLWFNANYERDWRIESSTASQKAFAQAIAIPYYASNQFGSLNTVPIQPLQPANPIPTNTPTPTPVPGAKLVQNGSFENTGANWLSPWFFNSKTGTAATITQDNTYDANGTYSAQINATTVTTNEWDIQLIQPMSVTAGQNYTLSFSAKASAN